MVKGKRTPALDVTDAGKTNRYYSEEERLTLKRNLALANEDLRSIRAKKATIERREKAIIREIERYLIALGPIKRLPDDVLCYIFELRCQDEQPTRLSLRPVTSDAAPQIILAQICSAWRQIMLNTPTFWCNIRVDMRHDPDIPMVELARRWLSRARDVPCSIELGFTMSTPDYYDSYPRMLWQKDIVKDIIAPYKFKKLDVTFADHHLRNLLELPCEKLSYVEELCLRYVKPCEQDIGDFEKSPSPSFDFGKLSRLTTFSLLRPSFQTLPVSMASVVASAVMAIPWHRLHYIRLQMAVPAAFCLTILEYGADILETCFLTVCEVSLSGIPTPGRAPIHCNKLQKFEVDIYHTYSAEETIDPFLLGLRLPNLKSLTIGSPNRIGMRVGLKTLLKMQDTSEFRLEELTIFDSAFTIDVRALLTSMRSLRQLQLPTSIIFTEDAMEDVASGAIGTHLEDLTLKSPVLGIGSLLRMVQARSSQCGNGSAEKTGPSVFKSVVLSAIDPDGALQDEYGDTIDEINESGVKLEVNFQGLDDESDEYSDEYYEDDYYDEEDDEEDDEVDWLEYHF